VPVGRVLESRRDEQQDNDHLPIVYSDSPFLDETKSRFDHVVLGGTFDHLHSAHMVMLTMAMLRTRVDLALGLTTDSMLTRKANADVLEPYALREHRLLAYCDLHNAGGVAVKVYPLSDNYGCATIPDRQLLIVSEEKKVLDTAPMVNTERARLGLSAVEIYPVPLMIEKRSEGQGRGGGSENKDKVSSSSIRAALVGLHGDGMVARMSQQWVYLCSSMGISDEATQSKWFGTLSARYHSEKQRAYHTLRHVAEMLALIDYHRASLSSARAFDLVRMATWFHDVVYEPLSKTNERDSADLWRVFAAESKLGVQPQEIDLVYDYILATQTHVLPVAFTPAQAADCAVFLDIDMSILAALPRRYAEYALQIAFEFQAVENFATKRTEVLQSFLDKDKLFYSPVFDTGYYNQLARYNIQKEIELLSLHGHS
jgi:predicted metal-dependent HD superfamily phosphohydrolase/phosphopantetheine adenylyltransferase